MSTDIKSLFAPDEEKVREKAEEDAKKRQTLENHIIEMVKPIFDHFNKDVGPVLGALPIFVWGRSQRHECKGETFIWQASFSTMNEQCSIGVEDEGLLREVDNFVSDDHEVFNIYGFKASIKQYDFLDGIIDLYGGDDLGGTCFVVSYDDEEDSLSVVMYGCDTPE